VSSQTARCYILGYPDHGQLDAGLDLDNARPYQSIGRDLILLKRNLIYT